MKIYRTKVLDEAAYYVYKGATFVEVIKRKIVQLRKIPERKKRPQTIWTLELIGVTESMIDDWWTNKAICNVRDYMEARAKLKTQVITKLEYARAKRPIKGHLFV